MPGGLMLLPRVLGLVQSCRWEEDDYVETLTSHLHFSKPSEFYAWRSNAKVKLNVELATLLSIEPSISIPKPRLCAPL